MSSTSAKPVEPSPFPVRTFSVEEYRRLGELGILTEDDSVELLAGWIVPKMIHNPPHDAVVELVHEALRPLLPDGWRIRIQSAITTKDSEPEPDLAIVRGSIRAHIARHPSPNEIALVVEVADSSLQRDRLKTSLYARAGIPAYWIVNLVEAQLEIHSHPSLSESNYRHRDVVTGSQSGSVVIEQDEVGKVRVADLMP